jgi:hypothetical protein
MQCSVIPIPINQAAESNQNQFYHQCIVCVRAMQRLFTATGKGGKQKGTANVQSGAPPPAGPF